MSMTLIIAIISLVLSVVLLMGKGAFLIAGYNTASKAEKAKYDEKKLCRIVGVGLLPISFGMLLNSIDASFSHVNDMLFVLGICYLMVSAILVNFTNMCKKKDKEEK